MSASSRSLHNTQEVAAMTRSLPEHEVLKYLSHGHPLPAAEGSSITNNTFRYTALLLVTLHTFIVLVQTAQASQKVQTAGAAAYQLSKLACIDMLVNAYVCLQLVLIEDWA